MKYIVLSFYKYCDIKDPHAICLWQKVLLEQNNLLGRIIVASEGVNGTLCGEEQGIKEYKKAMKRYPLFQDILYKESLSDFMCFDSIKVKFKEEIVILREDKKKISWRNAAEVVDRDELHAILQGKENKFDLSEVLLFDTRNFYESRIGAFKGALCPNVETSREFASYFKKNSEKFKEKKVIMYCTAGVRCERISVLCKKYTQAKNVYHLRDGLHAYCQKYPDGFFRGSQYVFDDRVSIKINGDILTHCDICRVKCDKYNNCLNAICNKQYICCVACYEKNNGCCSSQCIILTNEKKVPLRPALKSRQ